MGNTFENGQQFFATLRVLREQRKQGTERAGIFGSRAAATHRPESDIDIFLEIEDPSILGLEQTREGDIHLISTKPGNDSSGANLIRKTTRWLWSKNKE